MTYVFNAAQEAHLIKTLILEKHKFVIKQRNSSQISKIDNGYGVFDRKIQEYSELEDNLSLFDQSANKLDKTLINFTKRINSQKDLTKYSNKFKKILDN